ncbi:cadherin-related family member 5-like isoform X1 [Cheilinus undulatus]|uniref:cadherin-related family member 5-like isoform X1 n=1 Tax=Cheilinus undulatus TaxID=241271 RepID=UPI001BD5534F|nr:cadherin-related family member 5-like isoform X1 [Cheilinus undulatus]
MEGINPHFTVRTAFSLLLLVLLQSSTEAQICIQPDLVRFPENNTIGEEVVTITHDPEVTLSIDAQPEGDPFRLVGNILQANKVFDHESDADTGPHVVRILCTAPDSTFPINVIVIVDNINDNPPIFDKNPYNTEVNELAPVDTVVDTFIPTDVDSTTFYFTLTSSSVENAFKIQTSPSREAVLLVETLLDYDKVKNVQLVLEAQDMTPGRAGQPYTATTTINVAIKDVDNRPPWFQPCTMYDIGGALVCQSAGYSGSVDLNEQEDGILTLKPGPLHAIDGDNGIEEEITYSFVGGEDGGGLFAIGASTGNITMLKPATEVENITLAVLAAQKINRHQFATTTVTISVREKSLHLPQFQKPRYEAVVTKVGAMAIDLDSEGDPLQFLATDDDYLSTEGINPHITYSIPGNSDFSIINRYLFLTKDLPDSTLSLEVVATDTSNDDTAIAELSVEVKLGLTTTSLPPSTTDVTVSTALTDSTTVSQTTKDTASTTIASTRTTAPSTTGEGTSSTTASSMTTDPSLTSEGTATPASTDKPFTVTVPSGGFGPGDMAALGATLGVLLFICLVVIVVLALQLRRGKADWKKIYETNMFRSTMGQGSSGPKEGIQYTNNAFVNDGDGDDPKSLEDLKLEDAIMKSTAVPLHALLPDNTSLEGSDKGDDKEVKPILTKERRMDDGYKSVWFKEDIDPNAKEEVVIIPDSREDDSEEEEEDASSNGKEENDDNNEGMKTPRSVFNEADLDSGLGVKMEDPAEDSDDVDDLTLNL